MENERLAEGVDASAKENGEAEDHVFDAPTHGAHRGAKRLLEVHQDENAGEKEEDVDRVGRLSVAQEVLPFGAGVENRDKIPAEDERDGGRQKERGADRIRPPSEKAASIAPCIGEAEGEP